MTLIFIVLLVFVKEYLKPRFLLKIYSFCKHEKSDTYSKLGLKPLEAISI